MPTIKAAGLVDTETPDQWSQKGFVNQRCNYLLPETYRINRLLNTAKGKKLITMISI